jgi:hypothetical protein
VRAEGGKHPPGEGKAGEPMKTNLGQEQSDGDFTPRDERDQKGWHTQSVEGRRGSLNAVQLCAAEQHQSKSERDTEAAQSSKVLHDFNSLPLRSAAISMISSQSSTSISRLELDIASATHL